MSLPRCATCGHARLVHGQTRVLREYSGLAIVYDPACTACDCVRFVESEDMVESTSAPP